MECFKLEQDITDYKITGYLNSELAPRCLAKWIKHDERLNNLIIAHFYRYTKDVYQRKYYVLYI